MTIHGFSRNASDLFKIAVLIAGFDRRELLLAIHRRVPHRATVRTVEEAMGEVSRRFAAAAESPEAPIPQSETGPDKV